MLTAGCALVNRFLICNFLCMQNHTYRYSLGVARAANTATEPVLYNDVTVPPPCTDSVAYPTFQHVRATTNIETEEE
jgi:hypothetical protein